VALQARHQLLHVLDEEVLALDGGLVEELQLGEEDLEGGVGAHVVAEQGQFGQQQRIKIYFIPLDQILVGHLVRPVRAALPLLHPSFSISYYILKSSCREWLPEERLV
jgi:hypothetical protein